jgi:hypothetical protein
MKNKFLINRLHIATNSLPQTNLFMSFLHIEKYPNETDTKLKINIKANHMKKSIYCCCCCRQNNILNN